MLCCQQVRLFFFYLYNFILAGIVDSKYLHQTVNANTTQQQFILWMWNGRQNRPLDSIKSCARKGTYDSYQGENNEHKEVGTYKCAGCDQALYELG